MQIFLPLTINYFIFVHTEHPSIHLVPHTPAVPPTGPPGEMVCLFHIGRVGWVQECSFHRSTISSVQVSSSQYSFCIPSSKVVHHTE